MAKFSDVPIGGPDDFGEHTVLIQRADPQLPRSEALVLLVHGLNGAGIETWAGLLKDDWIRNQPDFDLGFVNHSSGLKRFRFLRTPSPAEIARRISAELNQLGYRRVVLVGHSMGGLIIRQAVRETFLTHGPDSDVFRSIVAVVSISTPSTGSGYARLLRGPARKDYNVLRRDSDLQHDIERFFTTHIDPRAVGPDDGRPRIALFAGSASHDEVVRPLGAELGVPDPQRMPLPGNHSSVLGMPETHRWLEDVLRAALAGHRRRNPIRPQVVSEFHGSSSHPGWQLAYHQALEAQDPAVAIDSAAGAGHSDPNFLLRAYDAELDIEAGRSGVAFDAQRQSGAPAQFAIAVCPIGWNHSAEVAALTSSFGASRNRWFQGCGPTDAEVLAVFHTFFKLAVSALYGPTRETRSGQKVYTDGIDDD